MKKELKQTRKHNGEEYLFYLYSPSYEGEKGCCGIELTPYIAVMSPLNYFGYRNVITLEEETQYDENGIYAGYIRKPVTHERNEMKSVLKSLTKQIVTLEKKCGIVNFNKTIYDL